VFEDSRFVFTMSAIKGSASTLDLEKTNDPNVAVVDAIAISEFDDPNVEADSGVDGLAGQFHFLSLSSSRY
jgi:hypothetical protein